MMPFSTTLIMGGARSGKSTYAEQLARHLSENVLYVATATAGDDEMRIRIERHRSQRPPTWQTLEASTSPGKAILQLPNSHEVVLIDCITLWISNLLLQMPEGMDEGPAWQSVQLELDDLLQSIRKIQGHWILVSNEVGLGLVPPYPLGRLYRDVLGRANQYLAVQVENVIFLVAGIPMTVKGNLITL